MNGEKDKVEGLEIQAKENIKVADVPSTSLSTPLSGVSVAASGKGDIDHEFYYPENVASKVIALNTTADLGMQLQPEEEKQLVKSLDIAKTYVSEIEISLSLRGLKFKIKREPRQKIIKSYRE